MFVFAKAKEVVKEICSYFLQTQDLLMNKSHGGRNVVMTCQMQFYIGLS